MVQPYRAVSRALGSLPPSLRILSPARGTFFVNTNFSFTSSAFDLEDGSLIGAVQWRSNLDGALGRGNITHALSPGTHVITASVTDSSGRTTTSTVRIVVQNEPPMVSIDSPSTGTSVDLGTTVALIPRIVDFDSALASVVWTDSLEGVIATGPFPYQTYTFVVPGLHHITLSATDVYGGVGEASVDLLVRTTSGPPTIIPGPHPDVVNPGAPTELSATALDPEDGNLSGSSIEWYVTDGNGTNRFVGTGTSVTTTFRERGCEGDATIATITIRATDSDGNVAETRFQIGIVVIC